MEDPEIREIINYALSIVHEKYLESQDLTVPFTIHFENGVLFRMCAKLVEEEDSFKADVMTVGETEFEELEKTHTKNLFHLHLHCPRPEAVY